MIPVYIKYPEQANHMNTCLCLIWTERAQIPELEHEDEYLEAQCTGADFPCPDALPSSCSSLDIQVSKEIILAVLCHLPLWSSITEYRGCSLFNVKLVR